ncbi:condensation domain-containing protein, partial [Chitinophaga varians]|uniref:condensation domain-containing protein n=1 Tax=Chitinophaga varians TaxID=2202339 RepID=UPI0019B0BCA9
MNIDEYITHLRKHHHVLITVENEELRVRAKKEDLSPEIVERIRAKKEEILSFFKAVHAGKKYLAIKKAPDQEYYPLSSAQRRLYFLYELAEDVTAYNVPQVIKIEGVLDREKVVTAFNRLLERHETLRTVFVRREGIPYQQISTGAVLDIQWRKATEGEVPAMINDFIRPFDLGKAPLMRIGVISLSPASHVLIADMHHIITDGVSQKIFIQDFIRFYKGEELPMLALQYRDYAEWQQSDEQQKAVEAMEVFWLSEFADMPGVLELATDFSRPPIKSYEGGVVTIDLSKEETAQLRKICEQQGVTMYMLLLAGYYVLLSRLSGQEDIVVGTPVAGREHADLEQIIGMFVNSLALRCHPSGHLRFAAFLEQVKEKVLTCVEQQNYPYEELIHKLKVDRDASRNPLFDTMFSFDTADQHAIELPGLTITPYRGIGRASKFDLSLLAYEQEDQLYFEFEYAVKLFREESVERFAAGFRHLLLLIVADTSLPLSALCLPLPPQLAAWCQGEQAESLLADECRTFTVLFAEQAARTPLQVAVKHNGQELTYQELYSLSEQIAFHLQQRGVVAGDRVA